jgi:hypothetical protein
MAMASLTLVGNAADAPEPILRPSPATGYHEVVRADDAPGPSPLEDV